MISLSSVTLLLAIARGLARLTCPGLAFHYSLFKERATKYSLSDKVF